MRMSTVLAVLGFVLVAAGCSTPDQATSQILRGTAIIEGADNIVMPSALLVRDDAIIIADAEEPFLRVFDLMGNPVQRLGTKGEGPGEFRAVSSLAPSQGTDGSPEVLAFDYRQQRLTRFRSRDSLLRIREPLHLLPTAGMVVHELPTGGFIGTGGLGPHAFRLFNAEGHAIGDLGEIPFLSPEVPASLAQQIISGRAAVRPDGGKVAIGARWAGRIDIYDTSTGERTGANVPMPFAPEMRTRSNGAMDVFITDGSSQFAYIDLTATECCIYALFSGRTRSAFPDRAYLADQLQVFDWDGRLLKTYSLAEDVGLITTGNDGSTLYGLVFHPEPAVFRYDL